MGTRFSKLSVGLALQLCVTAAHGQSVDVSGVAGEPLPEDVSTDDWASIRAAYEAGRHAISAVEDGHRAFNPGQQWTTHFDGRGFTTSPALGEWAWGLQLEAYGWGTTEPMAHASAAVTNHGPRVSYSWDARLTEWYVNDRRGLEHGYTVHERPEGTTGALALELSIRGRLLPVVSASGRDVRFCDEAGGTVLTYAGLTVLDAEGRSVEAAWTVRGVRLLLHIEDQEARYPLTIDPIAQQAYLKASNTGADDQFGRSVAVSGGTVIVGAPNEDSAAVGVDGDQVSDAAPDSGAAYVFVRSGSTWTQQAYLKASNTGEDDQFGYSVSVSDDTVVVGAPGEDSAAAGVNGDQISDAVLGAGAAYIFLRSGTTWTQQAYLKPSNTGAGDRFGVSVAIAGDTVVVGAAMEDSGAIGVNGDQGSNVANQSGATYVFVRGGTSWNQEAYLKASNTGAFDFFGASVACSGDTVVVGAPSESSAATGVNGDQGNNASIGAGAAYVFVRGGTTWTQQAYLKASNTGMPDSFGASVACSGDTVVVGAHGESSAATGVNGDQSNNAAAFSGAAYVFLRSGTNWTQQAYLKASNTDSGDRFGSAVAVSGDTVVVGAPLEDSASAGVDGDQGNSVTGDRGAAYLFVRSGVTWIHQYYLKASNPGADDQFGSSVAIGADTLLVGAAGEASASTGIDGDQGSNSAPLSGAAYVFAVGEPFSSSCSGNGGVQTGCTSCPCGNEAPPGTVGGCFSSAARSARLAALGGARLSGDTLRMNLLGGTPSSFGVLTSGDAIAPTNPASPCFGLDSGVTSVVFDGLRCVVQNVQRHGSRPSDANGNIGITTNGWGPPSGPAGGLLAQGGFVAGQTRHFQVIYRDHVTLGCMTGQNTSQAVSVTVVP